MMMTSSQRDELSISDEQAAECLKTLRPYDVVCGRDKLAHMHPGNKRYKQLIHSYRSHYQAATKRDDKTAITWEVINTVQTNGGRFMMLDPVYNVLVEADPKYTHEKVSHALRSARDPEHRKPKKKRKIVPQPPTAEEEAALETMLTQQQAYFSDLLQQDDAEQSAVLDRVNTAFKRDT